MSSLEQLVKNPAIGAEETLCWFTGQPIAEAHTIISAAKAAFLLDVAYRPVVRKRSELDYVILNSSHDSARGLVRPTEAELVLLEEEGHARAHEEVVIPFQTDILPPSLSTRGIARLTRTEPDAHFFVSWYRPLSVGPPRS